MFGSPRADALQHPSCGALLALPSTGTPQRSPPAPPRGARHLHGLQRSARLLTGPSAKHKHRGFLRRCSGRGWPSLGAGGVWWSRCHGHASHISAAASPVGRRSRREKAPGRCGSSCWGRGVRAAPSRSGATEPPDVTALDTLQGEGTENALPRLVEGTHSPGCAWTPRIHAAGGSSGCTSTPGQAPGTVEQPALEDLKPPKRTTKPRGDSGDFVQR